MVCTNFLLLRSNNYQISEVYADSTYKYIMKMYAALYLHKFYCNSNWIFKISNRFCFIANRIMLFLTEFLHNIYDFCLNLKTVKNMLSFHHLNILVYIQKKFFNHVECIGNYIILLIRYSFNFWFVSTKTFFNHVRCIGNNLIPLNDSEF